MGFAVRRPPPRHATLMNPHIFYRYFVPSHITNQLVITIWSIL